MKLFQKMSRTAFKVTIDKSKDKELARCMSPVFYPGSKNHNGRMALTGEIIIHFLPNWSQDKINAWLKGKGLPIVKSFPFSSNTFLVRAESPLKSLELANEIYLSKQVLYAYPNWLKTRVTRNTQSPDTARAVTRRSTTCYPWQEDFWTGSASFFDGYNDDIYIEGANADKGRAMRGFAKFDISSIPDGSTIKNVDLHIYCYQDKGISYIDIRKLSSDPVTASWHTTFDEAGSGTLYVNGCLFSRGYSFDQWKMRSLGSHAAGDL